MNMGRRVSSARRHCCERSPWTRQGLAWALALTTMGGVVSAAGQRPDAPGTLLIISEPAEADVYVDGAPAGKTPVSVPTVAGDHRVRLVKAGFLDNSRVVTTSSRKPLTMRVTLTARAPSAPAGEHAALTIVVVEGEDAVNIIQQRTAVAPVVEVRDRNNQPVPGALVRFAIRNGRATFSGARTLSVTTNAAGRAIATGLTPTSSGALQIGATASFGGQTAAVTIAQTNVLTAAQAAGVASAGGGAGAGAGA
ncbi:MAG: PEGA domain-containing protein, partial [Vicinamibacterales bacterium]